MTVTHTGNNVTRLPDSPRFGIRFALVATLLALSVNASADNYSLEFANTFSSTLDNTINVDVFSFVECNKSKVVKNNPDIEAVGKCVRLVTDHKQSETGLLRYLRDFRAVKYRDRGYLVVWTELQTGARSYLEGQPPRDVTAQFIIPQTKSLTAWTKAKTYSAGLTRQYRGATAKNADGKTCLILSAKRGGSDVVAMATCGDDVPEKKELKAFLKAFR